MKELLMKDLLETQKEIDFEEVRLDGFYRERESLCSGILSAENCLDRLKIREKLIKEKLEQIEKEENNEKER